MNNCFVLLSIMGGIRVDTRDLCQRKFSPASDHNDAAAAIVEPSPGIRHHLSFAFHRKPGFHITRENERVCEFGSSLDNQRASIFQRCLHACYVGNFTKRKLSAHLMEKATLVMKC
jgi:hypothetical protein